MVQSENTNPEIPLCHVQNGYLHFPYPPDRTDGRTNNGGIDLIQEPHRIDEITELKALPSIRAILLKLRGPESEFITLGFEAGAQEDAYYGYLEFAFRDPRLADEENYRNLLRRFSDWTLQRHPRLAPCLPSCLHAEIQGFFYREKWHGDRMTLSFRAVNRDACDDLLHLIADFLMNEISPQLKLFRATQATS